jgi:dihydrofolate reductase
MSVKSSVTVPAGSSRTEQSCSWDAHRCTRRDEFLAAAASTGHIETRRYEVGALHVHEFISLDGVIDAPTWTFDYGFDPKMGDRIAAFTARSQGILLGRTTYEMFEPAWSTRTVDDDPGAPFFNDTTKYVVSSTLTDATWRNSALLGPYDPGAIRRLKDDVDGDLYTAGSGTLVRALLADGLVDELHLFVFPLTRGKGPRLFQGDSQPQKLSLAEAESYGNGVVYLGYRPQP